MKLSIKYFILVPSICQSLHFLGFESIISWIVNLLLPYYNIIPIDFFHPSLVLFSTKNIQFFTFLPQKKYCCIKIRSYCAKCVKYPLLSLVFCNSNVLDMFVLEFNAFCLTTHHHIFFERCLLVSNGCDFAVLPVPNISHPIAVKPSYR